MPPFRLLACGLLAALLPLAGQALCTSDGVAQPAAVLERFLNADCADCWTDAATPTAPPGTLALDWVLPGTRGADAPLAPVAIPEAQERLSYLGRTQPRRTDAIRRGRAGAAPPVRLALGQAINDYVGTSLEIRDSGGEAWGAWLLLVETLPAGTESSPVPRHLVRNVFRPDWQGRAARAPGRLAEARAMQIHEGARPERLSLVAVIHDRRGRIRAISRTECR